MEGLQNLIRDIQNRFQRKGEERLTIMVIPHGQDKIFSLQLNWFMIAFLVGVAGLAVFLAFYGFYLNQAERQKARSLRELYGANFSAALTLKKEAEALRQLNGELRDNLEEIASGLGMPDMEMAIVPVPGEADRRAEQTLEAAANRNRDMGPRLSYLPPVYSLKGLRFRMRDQAPLLTAVRETLLDGGFGVYAAMPVGRPFSDFSGLRDTSGFGFRRNPVTGYGMELHTGYDTAGPHGKPIIATAPGEVHRILPWSNGYGRAVVLQHAHGFFSMYAHLAQIDVQPGDQVRRGDVIGRMGSTGRTTGTHLHYEIWLGESQRVDPRPFVCSVDFRNGDCARYHRADQTF